MSSEIDSVSIKILGKEYQISCPPSEEEALRKSAKYLDEQMSRIKARSSTLGFEKIAVMAALNISHELLKRSLEANSSENNSLQEIKALEEKIDQAMQNVRQLEI